jgi:hypothetical protein
MQFIVVALAKVDYNVAVLLLFQRNAAGQGKRVIGLCIFVYIRRNNDLSDDENSAHDKIE